MEQQTEIDRKRKTLTARCAVCHKAKTQKKGLFRSLSVAMLKLSLNFNYCRFCKKWVCEDCFLIDDGNGNAIGICTTCAKGKGVTGLTIVQFEEAWPHIKARRQLRIEAAKRAMEKQEEMGQGK
jgi:hypothetical protein